jgi:hypothetical protein
MTRIAGRRRLLLTAVATASLVVGLTAPAQATPLSPVLFVDVAHGHQLRTADSTGTASTIVGNFYTWDYDVSGDGSTLAAIAHTGDEKTAQFDRVQGLLVSHGGTTRLVSTYVQGNPIVSADGATVWFVNDDDLWAYSVAADTTTALTTTHPFASVGGLDLERIGISPDHTRVAALFAKFNTATPSVKTNSRVEVRTIASPATPLYFATNAAPTTQLTFDFLPWVDSNTFLYGICTNADCNQWSVSKVDVSALTPTAVDVPALANFYNIRNVGTTWYLWKDTVPPATLVTSLSTTTDLLGVAPTAVPPSRVDGDSTFGYRGASGAPVTVSATTATGRPASQPHLLVSAPLVKTGGRVVYAAWAWYLKGLGRQTFANDAAESDRGTLLYSVNAGKTWLTVRTTTSTTPVPWPTGGFGNGYTQKLSRTTWFRWALPASAFALPSITSVRVVQVSPTVSAKVTKSGSKRIVAGTAARVAGTAVLFKGTKKIASVKLSATGAYSFGKRVLSKGTYKVVTLGDASWAAGSVTVKI